MAKPGGTESFCRGSKESWPTLHRKAAAVRNLYNLNQGFEHVLGQLQQLEKLGLGHRRGRPSARSSRRTAPRSTSNLVEQLAEREERDWTFGRLRREREKKLRDPQDVLIEADRLRQQLKKRRAQRGGTQQQ
jgi:hypothetical protein